MAFLSKSFTATERNYEIYDRELLSIIRALQEWRHYIQGSPFKTKVLSDHKNLTYFRNPQKLNRRQARASLELSEYDLELKHIPGDKMVLADALSRRPDLCPVEDHDNENVVLLPEDLFVALIDVELRDAVAKLQHEDSIALEALRLLTEVDPQSPSLDTDGWTTEVDSTGSKVLFYKGKIYIPQDMELRREIVQRYHDTPTAGHPGILETYMAVSQEHWWPGLRTSVRSYVNGCAQCQQFKINRRPTKPALFPISSSLTNCPFAQLSMDFITSLPLSQFFDSIMVVYKTTRLFIENVYKQFGLPDKIITDCGGQFDSLFFQELCKALEIKSALTTAFHPQSDGSTELFNQEIELYLSIYCISNPQDWSNALPTLEFTHNN